MPSSREAEVALGHVPADERDRVLSGMRWSVWLSAIAVPFGAAINLLLARVGPETIGVYGLLSVYVGLITAFVYFGGDTVIIHFIPECRQEDRSSFLVSYFLVVFVVLIGWLVFIHFFPTALRLALSEENGDRFHFLILCLAPIPIVFAMIVASLKGLLDIRISQMLAKLLAITSLLVYAVIFVFARPLLRNYPTEVIWSTYIGLISLLAIVAGVRLIQLCGIPRLRFFLPKGFWRYAFANQFVGIVYFLSSRLDYVLIVNLGGLEFLGRYVAVMTVAATVPMVNTLFMDTLLPSLANTIAARNHAGAAQVFMVHMRILFLVATATSCAVMVLAVPATVLMGPTYLSVRSVIVLLAMMQGIGSAGIIGGTLLASVSRQQRQIWAGVIHLVMFTGLFVTTWHRWNLVGAAVAYGLAMITSNVILMAIALKTSRFFPSITDLWLKAAVVDIAVGAIALLWMPLGLTSAALTWLGAMALFLRLARYDLSECICLLQMFLPISVWRSGKYAD